MASRAWAILLLLITVVSVVVFWGHYWWFPVSISTHGAAMDSQFNLTLIICGIVFVGAQVGLAWAVWKYRDRGDGRRATYSHGNNTLEVTWTTAATIVFVGLNLLGYRIWAETHFTGASPGALRIEAWGEQFQWYFRYPGPDGQFGPSHPEKMNDGTGNYLGLDKVHDQASKDDIVTATLGIPVDREVEIILRSKDVNHSFYCRELRVHQDIVPGMEIPVHFTTTDEALKNGEGGIPGRYEIVCTQLCGLGHYKMRAFLQVMKQEDFEKWLEQQAAMQ